MSISFHERLNRIAPQPEDRANDQTVPPELVPAALQMNTPDTRITVINYSILGALWLYPTCWVLGRADDLPAQLPQWLGLEEAARTEPNIIWMSAMGSLLLYFTYFRFVYYAARTSSTTISLAHHSAFFSGMVAGILGYGPIRTLTEVSQNL